MNIQEQLKEVVEGNEVVLFMKGSPDFPQCGFSGMAAQILQQLGTRFASVDVLADSNVREGIKQYSNWPTIPQLYIKGEFIGGSDIMKEMFDNGELQKKIDALSA